MNRLKKVCSVVLACCLVWGLMVTTGCSHQTTTKSLQKVKLCETVHSIFYAPLYVSIAQGFFRQQGLDIDLTTAQGTDKAMTAVLSNAAQISLAGPEPTVYVFQQGRDDYAVNFAACTKRDGSFLVSKKAEPGFKWENLRGKTVIGGRPAGMPEMILEYVLRQHGLTPGKDVNVITNLQFTATAGAFQKSNADYVALFEPTASMLEKEEGGRVVASMGVSSGEVPYTGFFAKKSFIEKNPDLIQHFTNAVYRGQTWVKQHSPAEIADAIHSFFPDTDKDVMVKVITRYKNQDTWKTTPVLEYKDFSHMEDILLGYGAIKSKVNPHILVNQTFADKAVATVN